MTSAERFRQLIEDARKHAAALDAVAAHGFLTAAAICPGGYEHLAWQPGLFGEEPVDEALVHSGRECIAAIRVRGGCDHRDLRSPQSQGRPQRPLSLRQRQETQKMLYEQDVTGRPVPHHSGSHRAAQAPPQIPGRPPGPGKPRGPRATGSTGEPPPVV